MLCSLVAGSAEYTILGKDSEVAFRELAKGGLSGGVSLSLVHELNGLESVSMNGG